MTRTFGSSSISSSIASRSASHIIFSFLAWTVTLRSAAWEFNRLCFWTFGILRVVGLWWKCVDFLGVVTPRHLAGWAMLPLKDIICSDRLISNRSTRIGQSTIIPLVRDVALCSSEFSTKWPVDTEKKLCYRCMQSLFQVSAPKSLFCFWSGHEEYVNFWEAPTSPSKWKKEQVGDCSGEIGVIVV